MIYHDGGFEDEVIILSGSGGELRRLGEVDPQLPDSFETINIMFAVVRTAPVGTVIGRAVLSETPGPEEVIGLLISPVLPPGMDWEPDPDPTVGGIYPNAEPGSVWRLVVTGALVSGTSGVLPGDADGSSRGIVVYVMDPPVADSFRSTVLSHGPSRRFNNTPVSRSPSRGRFQR